MSTLLLAACLVIGVSDGDSMRVKCPARVAAFPVRLVGIDAPEVKHTGFVRTALQPWANESKAALTALCLKQTVDVKRIGFDRNRRALGYVTCQGKDASTEQLTAGNAWAFDVPAAQAVDFVTLEAAAKAKPVGLWTLPNPIAPQDWRKAGACAP